MKIFLPGLLFPFLLIYSFGTASVDYGHIEDLINNGDLVSADNELGAGLSGNFTDWKGALFQGMVQPDGDISISSLEKALFLCEDDCEGIISRLASAWYSAGEYDRVIELVKKNEDKLDNQNHGFAAFWFASLSYIRKGDIDNAEKIIRKADKSSGSDRLWGEILRANCQYLNDKKKDAESRLNRVISESGSSSFAALYNRTYFYASDNNTDRAYSGFSMLKEAQDEFIGLPELLDLMEGRSNMGSDGTAEKLTGVRYTIQIGTYADREEMDSVSGKLRGDGWSTFENSKFVDGRKYWILTVGSFQTVEKAQRTKKILEDNLKNSLKIVILE